MFVLFLSLLALGQVALADQFRFNFSTIQQCEPVSISFSGTGKANGIPTALTLIPFGSRPISIPLPSAAGNSTGVTVSFLPLPAGTTFVASIDDDEGDNSSRVSDVFRVFPSASGDASCLPSGDNSSPYTLPTTVSQCEPFTIPYTTDAAPLVRVFVPRGGSFQLSSQDNLAEKIGTYMLNATRQSSIVIMAFNDIIERGMSSSLLTVGGDASSPSDCFIGKGKGKDKDKDNSTAGQSGAASVSNAVAIGLGVGGGAVLLVTIALGVFLCYRRRQQRTARNLDFNPALLEKRSSYTKSEYSGQQILPSQPYSPAVVSYSPQVVTNPPYTASRFSKSTNDSYPVPTWTPPQPAVVNRSGSTGSPGYDIERALNYVSEQGSRDDSPESPPIAIRVPTPIDTTGGPRVLTPYGRHEARPSGVPLSAIEPATPNGDTPRESFASSTNFEMLSQPPVATTATSSSNLLAPSIPSSRFSDASYMGAAPSIGDFPRPPIKKTQQRDSTDSWGNLGSARW